MGLGAEDAGPLFSLVPRLGRTAGEIRKSVLRVLRRRLLRRIGDEPQMAGLEVGLISLEDLRERS